MILRSFRKAGFFILEFHIENLPFSGTWSGPLSSDLLEVMSTISTDFSRSGVRGSMAGRFQLILGRKERQRVEVVEAPKIGGGSDGSLECGTIAPGTVRHRPNLELQKRV